MTKSELFSREIAMVQDIDLQDFLRWYLDEKVGAWFWRSGASSSGKYHPAFAQGEGGLVRHTRAVVMVCAELLRMSGYAYMRDEYKDYAIAACILHDTCKYGDADEENADCYKLHGKLAAEGVRAAWQEFFNKPAPEFLCLAIQAHMGQWTENREERPFTNIDRLVHLADYIASRSFWDIPQLCEEYDEDYEKMCCEAAADVLHGLPL